MKKINIPDAFNRFSDHWSPHIAGRVNNQEIRIAKIEGAFDWHAHAGIEEAFFVVKGAFNMEFRDQTVLMEEGDFLVVPADVEHRPVAQAECWIMMIETEGTVNTGAVVSDKTRTQLPVL